MKRKKLSEVTQEDFDKALDVCDSIVEKFQNTPLDIPWYNHYMDLHYEKAVKAKREGIVGLPTEEGKPFHLLFVSKGTGAFGTLDLLQDVSYEWHQAKKPEIEPVFADGFSVYALLNGSTTPKYVMTEDFPEFIERMQKPFILEITAYKSVGRRKLKWLIDELCEACAPYRENLLFIVVIMPKSRFGGDRLPGFLTVDLDRSFPR